MTARRANQDGDSFILRTTSERDHGLLLKLDVSITIDRVRQRAETLLSRNTTEARNRTLA
jgi:hypothetical protein